MTWSTLFKGDAATGRLPASSFGREWMKAPLKVGAVAPSSSGLARAITNGLSASDGPVIELGPGTGVFTSALLARGIPDSRIAAIEASSGFASALAARYPAATVICADAARIRHLNLFGVPANVVICGLPLLSMPHGKVFRILAGSFASLRPGGSFRLFTYGWRCPVPGAILDHLGIVTRRIAFVPFNIPPAWVYELRREKVAE
ncbi:class I SAM-dependent methyltransferase [Hoeflea prorocentri]|uniref:Phospholipid methyltransferase n=1 Tax=Hoeflea prorocentri TaxID=1922333 RepID=A0A9X3UG31_9HYPH|nr:methyltransferase domain-containing protein [Hoeflea prorocentri]MCY6380092.1 phospholipid methyltransferase [Hoeflea prorocentri]MDA5397892.1 phospholipid methyltransferase [Hoeflea prorocentri]